MPVYTYRALTKAGKVVTGKSDDVSRQKVTEKLKANGLQPISVDEQRGLRNIKQVNAWWWKKTKKEPSIICGCYKTCKRKTYCRTTKEATK